MSNSNLFGVSTSSTIKSGSNEIQDELETKQEIFEGMHLLFHPADDRCAQNIVILGDTYMQPSDLGLVRMPHPMREQWQQTGVAPVGSQWLISLTSDMLTRISCHLTTCIPETLLKALLCQSRLLTALHAVHSASRHIH